MLKVWKSARSCMMYIWRCWITFWRQSGSSFLSCSFSEQLNTPTLHTLPSKHQILTTSAPYTLENKWDPPCKSRLVPKFVAP